MAASEGNDGPVLSLMNKRLRALRKKYNRILQMEEAISQGKPINKEQEEVLRSKPSVLTLIDEYEKLRQPLSIAVQEELSLAHQHHQVSATPPPPPSSTTSTTNDDDAAEKERDRSVGGDEETVLVEDLLKLLYFGSLFDVKPQSDFTSTMLTRTHERGCCLSYDVVTEDAIDDMLGEKDLDMISALGGLVTSRPVNSSLSHRNALRSCLEHAKLWLANSDQPIYPEASLTYAGLRERLNKIMALDYFTKAPEMRTPVEVAAAAAGNYGSREVPVQDSSVPESVPVQTEITFMHNDHELEETVNAEGQEVEADQYPDEESAKDGSETSNPPVAIPGQQDRYKPDADGEEQNFRDESKEQQFIPRRGYQNQRGGGRGGNGGRKGYPNGRGGRSTRGGGGYQNGRGQYYDQSGNYYARSQYNVNYDQSGNYYARNQYNARGRGGRAPGGNGYNNHGSGVYGQYEE